VFSRPARLAITAGTVAVLAGCATANSPHASTTATLTALEAVHLAAQHAGQENSFDASLTVQTSGTGGVSMSGTMRGQVRPSFEVYANLPTISADGQSLPGGISEVITAKAVYLKIASLSRVVGKPWIGITFSQISKATGGLNFSQLIEQAENNSPLAQTQLLAGADHVRVVGHGTINGTPVTEYAGTIQMSTALRAVPASIRAKVQQFAKTAGIQSTQFTVWLDSSQQPLKEVVQERGTSLSETITIVVNSLNKPVTVPVPPASETVMVPASALESGGASASASGTASGSGSSAGSTGSGL
jgi:hypothetical protein